MDKRKLSPYRVTSKLSAAHKPLRRCKDSDERAKIDREGNAGSVKVKTGEKTDVASDGVLARWSTAAVSEHKSAALERHGRI